MTTVALIGPDGAGKSSIMRRVSERLPVPSRTIYMGVNLESSRLMLPTTRLALELKRRRGGRPDMVGATAGEPRAGVLGNSGKRKRTGDNRRIIDWRDVERGAAGERRRNTIGHRIGK